MISVLLKYGPIYFRIDDKVRYAVGGAWLPCDKPVSFFFVFFTAGCTHCPALAGLQLITFLSVIISRMMADAHG